MPTLIDVFAAPPPLPSKIARLRAGHEQLDQAILDLLNAGLNGREVSRKLGIHPNTVYAVAKINKGVCPVCSTAVSPPLVHCERCRAKLASAQKKERNDLKRRGLCVVCKEPHCVSSILYCQRHLDEHRQKYGNRYQIEKAKRGTPNPGVPNVPQRERAIQNRYGREALEAWRTIGGCCEMCGVSYEQRAVHLHHIDGNPQNNTRANFACLCFSCHKLVHLLTGHPQRAAALRWIAERYPEP